jgi:hypothetical protein
VPERYRGDRSGQPHLRDQRSEGGRPVAQIDTHLHTATASSAAISSRY